MNADATQAPTVEVAPANAQAAPDTGPPAASGTHSSFAILAGPAFFAGSYVSTTPGIVAGLQYRTAGAHAFVLGARGGLHFPGKYTGSSLLGTLGVELGYRGNFLSPGSTEAGLLTTVTPMAAFGAGGESVFLAPVALGGFLRLGAFELQLTAAGGPAIGRGGPGGAALFSLVGGVVF